MGLLLFWVVFAVCVGIIASARGRSAVGWFFLSLLISPVLALILVMCLPAPGASTPQTGPQSRTDQNDPIKTAADAVELLEERGYDVRHVSGGWAVTEPMSGTQHLANNADLVVYAASRGASRPREADD